jgi:hypothetical protein
VTLAEFLDILKHNGPIIAVLLGIIWLQWRHIDKLLERNGSIYEEHIKALYQTQERLLTKLIGPQESSEQSPTMKQLKDAAAGSSGESKAINGEKA